MALLVSKETCSKPSAFKDSRFDPITLHEVDQLHCTVSILINFEKARDYRDWVVGIHGIRIEFQDNHHYRDAVYLPEVASEQGWDHTETIDNLMRKGGYRGHISEETRMKVNVVRFQSDKVLMSHQEYVDYKSNYGEAALTDPGGRRGNCFFIIVDWIGSFWSAGFVDKPLLMTVFLWEPIMYEVK
uniref:AMMECR1 domain-containing protein n=1 Tax=Setaria digitata TaxID=48799 RepID=A0A915Q2P3_9BILA